LAVCHNRRIFRHKVFDGLAARGKNSMGWFYGFKLHLIVNDQGELITFFLTPGNVDDRKPVPHMAKKLWGKLFADKGYISQPLFDQLFEQGVQLITPIRKNMKNRLMPLIDKILLRKRAIIETINDQLKNISQVAHTRHRSVNNFLVNLVAGLIAYTHQPKKPSLNLSREDSALLPTLI
jgi:transposase